MSVSTESMVTIEVDGKSVSARLGQMLIEVTDQHDINIPRFCYHKKLTVAANCRMCMVEVNNIPKPLPACATPVTDGMTVKTQSKLALEAQKSVMEFLLINHPLDCPICDQGGECELQDLAMGYGKGISRYQENKRVVEDKSIGPFIQTDLTRCIHCTRCVRFGEEIAGLRELGATGRGENMTIGTYIEKSIDSELSGNVIDLCPVGALTSKPFRYSARTWEMTQHTTIASHDGVGSNLLLHLKDAKVMRVVPAENEAINENWLSDRDRFSYEGLYSDNRIKSPLLKVNGAWQAVDWETAFYEVHQRLSQSIEKNSIGALISASSTVEEFYLLQKLMRGIGSHCIDHRLRQVDFSDDEVAPIYPSLGQSIEDLEQLDAALLVCSHLRKDQPMLNHRVRKAVMRGAKLMMVNAVDYDFNYPLHESLIIATDQIPNTLAAILKAMIAQSKATITENIQTLIETVAVSSQHKTIAQALLESQRTTVLLGQLAFSHPNLALIRTLSGEIAQLSNSVFGYLSEGANSNGAWLAGAVPHRLAGGHANKKIGKNAYQMLKEPMAGYLLVNVEPELDAWNAYNAFKALKAAQCVVSLSAFLNAKLECYADVILPIAPFAETGGTFINHAGYSQTFSAVAQPIAEAKPIWKILRVLGNLFSVSGFDYISEQGVLAEFNAQAEAIKPDTMKHWLATNKLPALSAPIGIQRIIDVPMNAVDPLTRQAQSLQMTTDIADGYAHINLKLASKYQLSNDRLVDIEIDDHKVSLPIMIDDRVADDCVLIHVAQDCHTDLGPSFASIQIK